MLSEKIKFSIKVSLSITLAFLIPFSQGWEQAQTAAITIMLIAAMGSVHESISKGALRVLGTLIGATVGMILIAIFPQERLFYLISLSIAVTITLYLLRAYKGDPSAFMLSAMTMMMVFDSGEVSDVFIYGLDKIYMSIFGIVIYSLVGLFLWPVKIEDTSFENAKKLSLMQDELYLNRGSSNEDYTKLLYPLIKQEEFLGTLSLDITSTSLDISQWESILYNYKNITRFLALEINHHKEYDYFDAEISSLFKNISEALYTKEEIIIPDSMEINYEELSLKSLSQTQKASLVSEIKNLQNIHKELLNLARKINSLNSPLPTSFELENTPSPSNFIWGNVEHLKASFVSFMIFWFSSFIWIYFNPPGGFMIVALATGLSVLTAFTPLKPSLLITVFSISFVFATSMYTFVLPNLHLAWELALFIFFYSFISFYLLPQKLTIFFLLGLFVLNITNQMHYNFSFFLLILLMFYMFLIILQIFYYIPFSHKPQDLFLKLKNRFFILAEIVFNPSNDGSLKFKILSWYAKAHLIYTYQSMKLFSSKIDLSYYNTIDKDKLDLFLQECQKLGFFLIVLSKYQDEEKEDIIEFYENMNLRKNINLTFTKTKDMMQEIDFEVLKQTKF